jgi:Zn-finger nucleic acid-binding protein
MGNALSGDSPLLIGTHACRTCSGLWLPKEQLTGRIDADSLRRLFHTRGGKLTMLRCPKDGAPLWETDVGGAMIDRCNSCAGLWFDAGELQAVLGGVTLGERRPKSIPASSGGNVLDTFTSSGDVAGEVVAAVIEFILSALAD